MLGYSLADATTAKARNQKDRQRLALVGEDALVHWSECKTMRFHERATPLAVTSGCAARQVDLVTAVLLGGLPSHSPMFIATLQSIH